MRLRTLWLAPGLTLALSTAALAQPVMTTAAGGGPDGIPAIESNIYNPSALAVSPSGELYIASAGLHRVFRLDAQGTLHRVAGHGGFCNTSPYGDDLPARSSCFLQPRGLAFDAAGNLYISDTGHSGVRRVDAASGRITRFAGNYATGGAGDGSPATQASLQSPHGLAFDRNGNLLVVERGMHRVRMISAATGLISTIAGTGIRTGAVDGPGGSPADDLGDGGLASAATLSSPYGLAIDAAGNLLIADMGNSRVRRVDAVSGIISTYAGNGIQGYIGDDGPASEASLVGPAHLAFDGGGNLLLAEMNDLIAALPGEEADFHRVRRIDRTTGIITTIAGAFLPGYNGDGIPATNAYLHRPAAVAASGSGALFIADQLNHRVRRVDAATGLISTIAGNGTPYFSASGRPAAGSSFGPSSLALEPGGNILLADSRNGRVWRVDSVTGIATLIAGNGQKVTSGDGGPALNAGMGCPSGIARDGLGNIYISDSCEERVRRIAAGTGIITTYAGNGFSGYSGDGGQATAASLFGPYGLATDPAGNLFIVDELNSRIRRVDAATKIITTFAGTGVATDELDGPGGDPLDDLNDGGPATLASLDFPAGVVRGPAGQIVISDTFNYRVRQVNPATGIITTLAGTTRGFSGDGGPAAAAQLSTVSGLAYDSAGNLFVGDTGNNRIRRIDALTGEITTVAGDGSALYALDGLVATSGSLAGPTSVQVDAGGSLYATVARYNQVRRILPTAPGAGRAGEAVPGPPLHLTRAANGDLQFSWGASCLQTDSDYALYEGSLGDFSSHQPRLCSTGGLTAVTVSPPAASAYYLVVPRNGAREGGYGLSSDGTERPASTAACLPQSITAVCQ